VNIWPMRLAGVGPEVVGLEAVGKTMFLPEQESGWPGVPFARSKRTVCRRSDTSAPGRYS
jgi:hypothetical protein